jgi:glycosyltransferase involved in cell wall biosynthesis
MAQLICNLDRQQFAPYLILMEGVGLERVKACVDDYFVMGVPQAGNSHWLRRSVLLASAVVRTRKKLMSWGADIVHATMPAPSILAGLAARCGGAPALVSTRGSLVSFYRSGGFLAAQADTWVFRAADQNVANCEAVSREMIRLGGCPPEKLHVIHNGVDTARFRPDASSDWRARMGWNERNVVFGMVANFRPCKRHRDFVDAAQIILRRHPEARFVMVGADAGLRGSIVRQVRDLHLDETKLRILDPDSNPERIFRELDVYVCASDSEGFSNVILEAMACAKPVIATQVGGNGESVDDGETGLLVPCRSPEAIAVAAEKLLLNSELRTKFGKRGRERVQQEFALSRMVHAYEELYLQLLCENVLQ